MSKNDKLPQLRNPMEGMSQLPQLFENAMPIELPRASFKQNSVSLFFGNVKRNQLVKATKAEAEIAEYSRQSVHSKCEAFFEVITLGSRVEDYFAQIKHNTIIRDLEVQEKQADIYMKQAQAQQMGFEAKLSELDYNMRLKQYQKMEESDD
jgi:hypothetical protein